MLEAVHLLLALELFIVVVGVDSRWLQRSLRHQYRDLAMSGNPAADPYLWAMPIEYLEKIFQIPLTLPAMQPRGYASLIASLAPSVPTPPSSGTMPETSTPRASADESPGGDRAPARALLEVQPGSSASGAGGQSIDLTPAEVQFAQGLGPLVDSPRAAKRFLGSDGPPGEYQAVLTLLAVAAAYPRVADRLLVALQDGVGRKGIGSWQEFITALDPGGAGGLPGALVPADLTGQSLSAIAKADAASWANLHQALEACAPHNTLTIMEPYQRWGSVAARFSFTL